MENSEWDIRRMLSWMEGYLSEHGDDNPRVSARWLVSDVTGLTFMELYTNLERPLDSQELDILRNYVKRRAAGEPLQYIIGKTSFRHIDVIVRKGVLIPRPETEVLVSEVLKRLPSKRYNVDDAGTETVRSEFRAADICTGSGCIACSLAFENPLIEVFATDISDDCIDLANKNVDALGLAERVHVLKCDLGDGLSGEFDAVVSNPPYIPKAVLQEMPQEVTLNEPPLALDGGEDGLDVFRHLVAWAIHSLKPDGFLTCELHETTLETAAKEARLAGFARTEIVNDLAGKPRVLISFK